MVYGYARGRLEECVAQSHKASDQRKNECKFLSENVSSRQYSVGVEKTFSINWRNAEEQGILTL